MENTKKISGFVIVVLIIVVLIVWVFIKNNWEPANIFVENDTYLSFENILEKIKTWKLDKINKKYKIDIPHFKEIVESEIEYLEGNLIKVTFIANVSWDSLHEFIYIFDIKNWKVLNIHF